MGSLTNLKTNKTLFTMCACESEILVLNYDDKYNEADLAMYRYWGYSNKMSLYQKLRYCYRVLVKSQPYSDQMILNKDNLKEMKTFLNGLNLD
jgi:hypothetical protein